MNARSEVELLMEYFRPGEGGREGPGRGLEVVEEEAAGVLPELPRDPAAGGVDRREDVPQLVGERRLGDAPLPMPSTLIEPLSGDPSSSLSVRMTSWAAARLSSR